MTKDEALGIVALEKYKEDFGLSDEDLKALILLLGEEEGDHNEKVSTGPGYTVISLVLDGRLNLTQIRSIA